MSRTHHNIITSCRVKMILAFRRIVQKLHVSRRRNPLYGDWCQHAGTAGGVSDCASPGGARLPKPDRVIVEKVRHRANAVTWGTCAAGRASERGGVDMLCHALRGMAGGPPDL